MPIKETDSKEIISKGDPILTLINAAVSRLAKSDMSSRARMPGGVLKSAATSRGFCIDE